MLSVPHLFINFYIVMESTLFFTLYLLLFRQSYECIAIYIKQFCSFN